MPAVCTGQESYKKTRNNRRETFCHWTPSACRRSLPKSPESKKNQQPKEKMRESGRMTQLIRLIRKSQMNLTQKYNWRSRNSNQLKNHSLKTTPSLNSCLNAEQTKNQCRRYSNHLSMRSLKLSLAQSHQMTTQISHFQLEDLRLKRNNHSQSIYWMI